MEITYEQLIEEAQILKSDDGENAEYDRALIELISGVSGVEIAQVERDVAPHEPKVLAV